MIRIIRPIADSMSVEAGGFSLLSFGNVVVSIKTTFGVLSVHKHFKESHSDLVSNVLLLLSSEKMKS